MRDRLPYAGMDLVSTRATAGVMDSEKRRPTCPDQFEGWPDPPLETDSRGILMPVRALQIMRCLKLATFIAVWIALGWSIWRLQS
jgi:hypothetical protein